MRKHWIIAATSLLGIGAVAAAGAGAGVFGSQSSVRAFARLAQQVVPASGRAAPNVGRLRGVNFVSGCRFSHRNNDDPIVYPGQPGLSHDHTFIGNNSTNAFSTLDTLTPGATSSCRRIGDTAAYWVPTLIGADGKPILPRAATVYYRRRTLAPVQPFPQGFKLIAGNSKSTSAQGLMITSWNCGPIAEIRPQATIPACPDAGREGLA